MFDEACVIRFADEASFIAYLKCTALGYRGNHRQDHYPAEHMPLHHTPGVPLSYKMINPEEAEALPKGENIGMYAFCTSPEEAERAETFCEKESGLHCFGGLVTSASAVPILIRVPTGSSYRTIPSVTIFSPKSPGFSRILVRSR